MKGVIKIDRYQKIDSIQKTAQKLNKHILDIQSIDNKMYSSSWSKLSDTLMLIQDTEYNLRKLLQTDTNSVTDEILPMQPKQIISMFAQQLDHLCELSTGVVECTVVSNAINKWYRARFIPDVRNPEFMYKATRIPEWLDSIIIYLGASANQGILLPAVSELEAWCNSLMHDMSNTWPIPYMVQEASKQFRLDSSESMYEVICLERLLKPHIYCNNFFLSQKNTLEQIVIDSNAISNNMKTDELIKKTKFTLSSQFSKEVLD